MVPSTEARSIMQRFDGGTIVVTAVNDVSLALARANLLRF